MKLSHCLRFEDGMQKRSKHSSGLIGQVQFSASFGTSYCLRERGVSDISVALTCEKTLGKLGIRQTMQFPHVQKLKAHR